MFWDSVIAWKIALEDEKTLWVRTPSYSSNDLACYTIGLDRQGIMEPLKTEKIS